MSRKRFIQAAATAFLPHLKWDLDRAIRYAERLWERLTERGHGPANPTGPRPLEDHYQALNPRQRHWFDRFWAAYNHKQGKQGAARRWGQLGELDDVAYRRIVEAARRDAARLLAPGQVRKMAQGWLAERRWEDHIPQIKTGSDQRAERLRELSAELAHARRLAEHGDDYWKGEAERLAREIDRLRRDDHEPR